MICSFLVYKIHAPDQNGALRLANNVEVVTSERDLGILISNDTSWKDHIVMIVAKANKMQGFLKTN